MASNRVFGCAIPAYSRWFAAKGGDNLKNLTRRPPTRLLRAPDNSSYAIPMKCLIIGAVLLGMNGCADIQTIGFVPWSRAAAKFQEAYNACHEDKPCREKAWANYHAELAAISSKDEITARASAQD
jgi:hypothetical protein